MPPASGPAASIHASAADAPARAFVFGLAPRQSRSRGSVTLANYSHLPIFNDQDQQTVESHTLGASDRYPVSSGSLE